MVIENCGIKYETVASITLPRLIYFSFAFSFVLYFICVVVTDGRDFYYYFDQ